MGDEARADRLQVLGMLASALAGRAVAVAGLSQGEPAWTDGQIIHVDADAAPLAQLKAVAVQASMIAAGSLEPDVVSALVRHRKLAKRYLTVEGHRALVANAPLLPRVLASLGDRDIAGRSDSARVSLEIAASRAPLEDPAPEFGVIGEADGLEKYDNDLDRTSLRKEKLRQELFEQLGLVVVRWGSLDLAAIDRLVERLNKAYVRGAQQTGPRKWVALQQPPGFPPFSGVNRAG